MNSDYNQPGPGGWVERLLDAETPGLDEKQRFWWRVWILRFLKFCRDPEHEGCELTPLAKGYLRELETDPELEEWKWSQAREALRVFARGIENWHWDEGKPRFRMRTRKEGECAGEPECAGDPCPVKKPASFPHDGIASSLPSGNATFTGEHAAVDSFEVPPGWREKLKAALRVQHSRDEAAGHGRAQSAGLTGVSVCGGEHEALIRRTAD